ncbi:helix-turn-helix domain-containing protein [Nocardia nova]|uniref:helix-turn-helix domain-containing protein n=1 Tax=Nocardia nova TaxID=37330 RepID=UPI0033DB923D
MGELGRFLSGEDVTLAMFGALLAGTLLLGTAWLSAGSAVFRGTCGLVGVAVLVVGAATQPHGWINVGGTVAGLVAFFASVVALARRQDRRAGRPPVSWRGGFYTRLERAPRAERKQARLDHESRTNDLAIALGIEIALLRIAAGVDQLTIADRLGISTSRYSTIEEAEPSTCVTVAELEAIAEFHDTTVAALYTAARDRIEAGNLPTRQERAARGFDLALGFDTDRYYTDHA